MIHIGEDSLEHREARRKRFRLWVLWRAGRTMWETSLVLFQRGELVRGLLWCWGSDPELAGKALRLNRKGILDPMKYATLINCSALLISFSFACSTQDDGDLAETSSAAKRRCGNGVVTSPEACDDGNVASGDGCSATCQVELDYICTGQPSVCVRCGDGICNSAESCSSCPQDCAPCGGNGNCGDGVCQLGAEDLCTCPQDCPPPNESAVCGDGICSVWESDNCVTECCYCTTDCGRL
jgi:cysteine-rich repeat protein